MITYDQLIARYEGASGNALEAALVELRDAVALEPDGVFDEVSGLVYVVLPGSDELVIINPTSSTAVVTRKSAEQPGAVHNVSSSDQGRGRSHGG